MRVLRLEVVATCVILSAAFVAHRPEAVQDARAAQRRRRDGEVRAHRREHRRFVHEGAAAPVQRQP